MLLPSSCPYPPTFSHAPPPRKQGHVTSLHICFPSFLSSDAGTNDKTTLLLLIVKTISTLPGAVYYTRIVIFYPKISDSPWHCLPWGTSTESLGRCQRFMQPHLPGPKGPDARLQSWGQ